MAKTYKKVQLMDKWLPVNRLSNFELLKYSQTKETEIFSEKDGLSTKKIPDVVLIQMAQLCIRRGLVKAA